MPWLRGGTMIEVLCTDGADAIVLQRPSGGRPRLQIGTHHTVEQVMDALGEALSPAEAEAFRRLWSQDGVHRNFTRIGNGVLFTLADE